MGKPRIHPFPRWHLLAGTNFFTPVIWRAPEDEANQTKKMAAASTHCLRPRPSGLLLQNSYNKNFRKPIRAWLETAETTAKMQ